MSLVRVHSPSDLNFGKAPDSVNRGLYCDDLQPIFGGKTVTLSCYARGRLLAEKKIII